MILGNDLWIRWMRLASYAVLGFTKLFFALGFVCVVGFELFLPSKCAFGQDSLATRIDASWEKDLEKFTGQHEADGLLLRRLSLDLRMLVPTPEELEEYIADSSPDRWSRWVQKFLDDPLHKERMVDWLDKTLLQRRPFQHVDRAKWLAYLRKVVDEHQPLDQIAKEIVASVWWNQSERAQQRFFLERAGDPHAIARDIGRVFFGKDMQCAQCHDHPQIDDFKQIDYHGLLAFVSPSSFVEAKFKDDKGAEQKLQIYVERAARDAPFESVFDKGIFYRTGTRAPGGVESLEPFQTTDQSYQAAPMPDSLDGAPAPPLSSRRKALLAQLSTDNRAFAANWSNRLWAMLLGKGLVHPLDMHHPGNPPTNPKLLDALTDHLIASRFHMRPIIEQIVMSDAYRMGGQMPIELSLRNGSVLALAGGDFEKLENELKARKESMKASLLSLEQSTDSAKQKLASAESEWKTIQKERVAIWADIDKAETVFKDVLKKAETAKAAMEKAVKQRDDTVARQNLLEDAAKKLEQAVQLGLPEDAELKQAIATAKSKAEASKTLIPGLDKGVTDTTVAKIATEAPLEAERTKLKDIAARLVPVEQRLHTADLDFLAARSEWQRWNADQVLIFDRIAQTNCIHDWLTSSRAVQAAEEELGSANRDLEVAKVNVATNMARVALLDQEVGAMSVAKNEALDRVTKVQEEGREFVSKRTLLENAAMALDKSLALVIETDSLIKAKQSIQSSIDSINVSLQAIETKSNSLSEELGVRTKRWEAESAKLASERQNQQHLEQAAALVQATVANKSESVNRAIEACSVARQAVVESRQKSGHLALTRPLSPEQLCLSIFQTTGVLKNYVLAELAEMDKQSPLAADASVEQRSTRKLQATRQAIDKLRSNMDVFASLYASGVGQTSDEFFASPDQALFMSNGGSVFQWSAPSGGNVTGQVAQQASGAIASKLLYRSLLSREPTPEEEDWIQEMLSKAGDKKNTIAQELVWSLLTSSEFRVYP